MTGALRSQTACCGRPFQTSAFLFARDTIAAAITRSSVLLLTQCTKLISGERKGIAVAASIPAKRHEGEYTAILPSSAASAIWLREHGMDYSSLDTADSLRRYH